MKMFRPGYAIEYDYFPPTQLDSGLETRLVKNLFFAGQINGTTGYEEAACQGLIAGINAHNAAHDKERFVLARNEAYIGVLVDDLIHKGTEEPYRMFTSRAEYRILLRQDNADLRLTPTGKKLGLADEERFDAAEAKKEGIEAIKRLLADVSLSPDQANGFLESLGSAPLEQNSKALKVLLRPGIALAELQELHPALQSLKQMPDDWKLSAEIELKYAGYIEKEQELVNKMNRLEHIRLQADFDYHSIPSLSMEARQKLSKSRPESLGQASRISGVSPSDISVLMVYMGRLS
jgi:tRNA uridine 5-carboxymethylaminomethyl modification enzyme